MTEITEQLSPAQRAAVEYIDGASLVIAAAGSGKTKVLTHKIAYLLRLGVSPCRILALTFTNKAAGEMKKRISQLAGADVAQSLWIGTFHAVFARILRSESSSLDYPADFTLYDTTEAKRCLCSIIWEMGLDEQAYPCAEVLRRISFAKNRLLTPGCYAENEKLLEEEARRRMPRLCEIYLRYCDECFRSKAMDFDDLLLQTYLLFRHRAEVLKKYREQFHSILIDEYQDTNYAQVRIIQQLGGRDGRVCAVGDDAQSIYAFRGADIQNIHRFQQYFSSCRVFLIERNYRSTRNLVGAANSLIGKNERQLKKNVRSEKEPGSKLQLLSFYSDHEEADAVATRIRTMQRENPSASLADFAVLYRINAQSRVFEEAFLKHSLPFSKQQEEAEKKEKKEKEKKKKKGKEKEKKRDSVKLMTVHAAKGLEFRNVFIVGLVEGLFPHHRASESKAALEEERRLLYVAITRAEENCTLTYTRNRIRGGKIQTCNPSLFLFDIDPAFLETPQGKPFGAEKSTEGFPTVGAVVSHPAFGEGNVTNLCGKAENIIATVCFPDAGERKLYLKYAKLSLKE